MQPREIAELYNLLIDSIRDYAIFVLDPQGRVLSWNAGAQRFKGYEANEIIGRHFSIFYPPELIEQGFPDHELRVAAETGRFEDEGWRVRKDGSRFWASVVITALHDEQGRLRGFGKVTRDLTERRETQEREMRNARRIALEEAARREAELREEEVRAMADQLERHTEELEKRTQEAVEARNRADEANKVKGQFLAAMSHELRTPLNAIGGYADLMLLGVPGGINAMQRDHLERIKRSQQHLLAIINDILGFTRIEAGQVTYDFTTVSLDDAAQSVTQMLLPQALAKGLSLRHQPAGTPVTAWADRAKVEQIVLNLVSNALKFTDHGEITLATSNSGGRASISVRDTGCGIPAGQLDAVFEPFVQVGRTLTSAREGTGLGLAISRDLARAMRGDVVATSEVDVGSEFTLTLPAASEQQQG